MDLMAIASIGMQNDLQKMEGISQNLANVLTLGYKRQVVMGASFDVQLHQASAQATSLSLTAINSKSAQFSLDPSMGVLKYTGNSQDVVIEGDGFFEVETSHGLAYTRKGNLHADANGRLVTDTGAPIMGRGGLISLSGEPFTITTNGEIKQGERIAGQLKRVRFENPSALRPLGNGLYDASETQMLETSAELPLRVGFQENSNVNSPQEMVRLTETVRHFESMQKIVQGYDDSLEKVIRKLGEF